MNGIDRIRAAFNNGGRAAMMPYFTFGYPDLPTSIDIIAACCASGADLMELGLPFSDPLADGPTVQHSTQVALQNGTHLADCLSAVVELRRRGIKTPFMLMGYTNPILRYGYADFVRDAAAAGADGFIIPDLPPDEAGELSAHCESAGLSLVYLLAPNSTPERTRLVVDKTTSFLYLVSVTGTTGARAELPPELGAFIQRVRSIRTEKTLLAVGFGISTPEQARSVGAQADGVIVGSALVRTAGAAAETGKDPAVAAGEMVAAMRQAMG